jgi:hypothetical protein
VPHPEQGWNWHCFRPSGAKFRPLVELAVMTDRAGQIVNSRLGLDRAFIDHQTDRVFARDIAKSFLLWAIANPVPDQLAALIENIADLSAAGVPTVAGPRQQSQPRPDATGGYDVYLGRKDRVEISLPRARGALTNVAGPLPARHIFTADMRVDVAKGLAAGPSWLAAAAFVKRCRCDPQAVIAPREFAQLVPGIVV